jgi:hypothetical protein
MFCGCIFGENYDEQGGWDACISNQASEEADSPLDGALVHFNKGVQVLIAAVERDG